VPPSKTFSCASYDTTTRIISTVCVVLTFGVSGAIQNLGLAILAFLLVLACYAWSPRGYTIADRSIVVKRLAGDARIPLDGLREARASTADDFRGCLRLFGNGGLFGYYGLFRTSKLGKCTWYMTNRRQPVVVVTQAKTALFSPDDVDGFLSAVGAEVAIPLDSPTESAPQSRASMGDGIWIGILLGVTLGIAVAVVAFAVLYSPGPPRYTLTAQSLTIHDMFYPVTVPASNVDIDRMRVVDTSVDTGWRNTSRTNGFANDHYRSGWFRVANGNKVRLYSTGSSRLVLLPSKGNGGDVLVEADNPDQFLYRLRESWRGQP
jgi:hypothetical protein